MVKIIKSGVCTYIKTCPKCHCEFSYKLNDLIEGISVDGIYCPFCNNFITHQTHKFYSFDETISNPVPCSYKGGNLND